MKKWLAILISMLLLATMIPMGAVSVSAAYEFLFPVNNGGVINYPYGYSSYMGGSTFHAGIDIIAYGDDTIYAAAGGTVVSVANSCSHVSTYPAICDPAHYNSFGNHVKVRHADGTYAIYGHLKQHTIRVAVGDTVVRGQALGTMGASGYSQGVHLHFEVRLSDNKTTVNTNHGGDVVYSTTGYNGTPTVPSAKLPDPICKPVREETFMIKNAAYPSMYMNVYGGRDANSTKVVAWEIDMATQDQHFVMEYLGDGSYYIRAAGLTNRVLDIYWGSNGVADYGDTLQVYNKGECDDTTVFNVVPVGSNKYALELKSLDNAVLTINGGTNNSTIGLYDYIANEAQHWYFCDLSGNIVDPYAGDHHTWDDGVPTTPATCVSTGVMTYTCTTCGLQDYHTIPVNAEAHSYGTYLYYWADHPHYKCYQCSHCGQEIANKAEPLYIETCAICNAPCEHTYDNACDTTCNACGEVRAVGDHDYVLTETIPATCTDEGMMTYTCTICGLAEYQTIPVTDHVYDNACDADCNGCGKLQDVAHDFVMTVQEATCTEYAKYTYTCQVCGYSYYDVIGDQVSDWLPDYPTNVDEDLIESKQEYRYREWIETTEPLTEGGWVLDSTYTRLGDYGDWSGWSDAAVSATENMQVETRTVYPYYYYQCPNCGAHMHVYLGCYTWAGGCGQAGINSGNYVQIDSTIPYSSAGLQDFHGTGRYYTYIDGQLVFQHRDGSKTQYRSRTRELETVYKYYRYTDWSDWSEACNDPNAMTEERTVYRYVMAGLADHVYDNANDTTCNECGAVRQIAAQVLSYGGSSISEDVNGLAFIFRGAMANAQVNDGSVYENSSATVIPFVNGESYKVVRMGAVVSNEEGAELTLENVNGDRTIAIEAKHLWDVAEDECSFAIRIIEIPDEGKDTAITARPYYVYEVDGEEIVVYGESVSKTYNEVAP